jgi:hypothetical protein
MIDDAIYERLCADTGLAALVSTRIYPDQVPQDITWPAIIFHQVSEAASYGHDGDSNLDMARFQFDCYGSTNASARAIKSALRACLSGKRFEGTGARVTSCQLDNSLSGYEPAFKAWRYIQDYIFQYQVL